MDSPPCREHDRSVERVERYVVQVAESNRMLVQCGVARWRISVLLLDNTTELLLKLECDNRLAFNGLRRELLDSVNFQIAAGQTHLDKAPFQDDDDEPELLTDERDRLERQIVSELELAAIERDFNRKTAYLVQNKFLSVQHGTVLKRLHKYRNEIYHEDKIRPATVEAAAKIYTYVVCDLMKRVRPGWVISMKTPDLDALFASQYPHSPSIAFLEPFADALLAQSPVGTPLVLSQTLSQHIIDRLDELDSDLDYIASGGGIHKTDEQTREKTLHRLVRVTNLFLSPDARKLTTHYGHVRKWRAAAVNLATIDDYMRAFDKFASLEAALEIIEEPVRDIVIAIDRNIEMEIDRRRGK